MDRRGLDRFRSNLSAELRYAAEMADDARADGVLLGYSVLVGLTPLIPLPFVDDAARGYLMRRMVRAIAEAHALKLWEEEVRELADERSVSVVKGMFRGLALLPIKLVLRKAIFLLTGKRIVDLVSEIYHRGFLLDRAFANGWCSPHGEAKARDLRVAMDALLVETPVTTSPVTAALRVGFERSRDALGRALTTLRARFSPGASAGEVDRKIDQTVEQAASDEASGLGSIVAELRRALTAVPREHFDALEKRLGERLGITQKERQKDALGQGAAADG